MDKLNQNILQCINPTCEAIPTIVSNFRLGDRIVVQAITCFHDQFKVNSIYDRYHSLTRALTLDRETYPTWLISAHRQILKKGRYGDQPFREEEIAKLRIFYEGGSSNKETG